MYRMDYYPELLHSWIQILGSATDSLSQKILTKCNVPKMMFKFVRSSLTNCRNSVIIIINSLTYQTAIIIINQIIIIWFGETVTVSHSTQCNTNSKVHALS